jgi:kumamolisin
VVAVGGTSVATNSSGGLTGETGWSGSGGGKSLNETIPTYQSGISSIVGSVRGVPDISSDADPNTGVAVYGPISNGRSTWLVFGGTSVSSPCMAGMVNAGGGTYTNTTTLLTNIYSHKGTSSFRDIISGTAGSFSCLSGWDFVTGVGTPQGFSGFLP